MNASKRSADLVRQDKPGWSYILQGAYAVIAHSTGSRQDVGGSNSAGEAWEGEPDTAPLARRGGVSLGEFDVTLPGVISVGGAASVDSVAEDPFTDVG